MYNINIGNKGNGGWGDCLFISAVFRHRRGKVILHNDLQSREVATVFNGIAEVEFSDNPPERPDKDCKLPIHRAEKILRSVGIYSRICAPYVKLTKDEIDWAKEFLKDFKDPVLVVNNNSGDFDPNNTRAHYVRPPVKVMQKIINNIIFEGRTPLQFGLKDPAKFTKLDNAVHIQGLNIRQSLACCKVIGVYVGGDTGWEHAMLSVGGYCTTLIPNESKELGYIYSDLLYKKENFPEDSKAFAGYINYNNPSLQ